MDSRHEARDIGVVDYQPLETQVVSGERHLVVFFIEVEQLLEVVIGGQCGFAAAGLKAETGFSRRDQFELSLQRQCRGWQRKEIVELGSNLLGAPE
jgi:hypothetical protein